MTLSENEYPVLAECENCAHKVILAVKKGVSMRQAAVEIKSFSRICSNCGCSEWKLLEVLERNAFGGE